MRKLIIVIGLFMLPALLCFGQEATAVSAKVKGRSVLGTLPTPSANGEGRVVVTIKVDRYGNVTEAIPGAEGTTITDKNSWNAARNAAMKAHFNMAADAPTVQTGMITYTFKGDDGEVFTKVDKAYTKVKDLVEDESSGIFVIRAVVNEIYDYNKLIVLVEEDEYIIPIQLVKKDLGAVNRFRNMNLHKGDTLTIKGYLSRISVSLDDYKGLIEASILDKKEKPRSREYSEETPPTPPTMVELKPSFNGGDANEFSKWVNSQLVYPEQAKEQGIQGRVTLQYTIDVDGSVKDVRVLRGVEPSLDAEAIRVVSMSPKWKPGKNGGKPVPVTYTFPVIFQLH